MIDIPTLSFKEIFENTICYIQKFSSSDKGIIDTSYQDPFQTLIELFALITDMQGFYMDYIGEQHYLKYIQLLGYELNKAIIAVTHIEIREVNKWESLPSGLPFYSKELISYESKYFTKISKNILKSIITYSNNIEMKNNDYVFQNISEEGSEIYIGFQESFNICPVEKIFIQISTQDITNDFIPLGVINIDAKIMGRDKKADWQSIDIIDYTNCFMQSGFIEIKSKPYMEKQRIGKTSDLLYWIRLTIKKSYFEISPIIKNIKINVLEAEQTKTHCTTEIIMITTNKSFILSHYLAIYGEFEIYYITENEQYIPIMYDSTIYYDKGYTECILKDFHINNCKLAIVYYNSEFSHRIYTSTGLPNQKIQLDVENIDEKSFKILVNCQEAEKGYWKLWKQVSNFQNSISEDTHFILKDNYIIFGNHEQGDIPSGSIKIISCKSSFFENGNIKEGQINQCVLKCSPNNITEALGGKKKQKIDDILNKIPKDLEQITKAVTIQNYMDILKTIPYFNLTHIYVYIDNNNPNVINILAKPKSIHKFPNLNIRYKQNILNYLESYRLMTTEIVIKGPEYFGVNIYISVEFDVEFDSCEEKTINELSNYFPYQGFDDTIKLNFGETISMGTLYKLLYNMPWILFVKDIEIKNINNIQIQKYHLVYINKISIVGA